MSARDHQTLRAFRALAAEVRAVPERREENARLTVVDGYIEVDGWTRPLRRLSVPVRRAMRSQDLASLRAALDALERADAPAVQARARELAETYRALLADLDRTIKFGDTKVPRNDIFQTWLDAMVFHDDDDRRRPYEELVDKYGKAIETTAHEIVEVAARQILDVDDLIEQVGVPSPPPSSPLADRPPDADAPRSWIDGLLRYTGWTRARRG
jgi:hypothetical protein